jgi:hypothetical protein
MLFVTIGLTGDPIGCYSSPIDAHEMAKRSVGATMTQCRLNSEVAREEHSHDYILTVDGACHSVYECASCSAELTPGVRLFIIIQFPFSLMNTLSS